MFMVCGYVVIVGYLLIEKMCLFGVLRLVEWLFWSFFECYDVGRRGFWM